MAAHHRTNLTALGFSAVSVYLMAIPYCDETRAACHRCAQLSSYAEFEITSHVPQAPSSFPSFAVHTASGRKLGRGLMCVYHTEVLGTRLKVEDH